MQNTFHSFLKNKQRRIFFLTFICMFIMVALHNAGLRIGPIMSPLPQKEDMLFNILPQLQKYTDTFTVKKQNNIFPQADAASVIDEAEAYGVIDYQTGEVILEKNIDKKVSIASLTKIMTAVIVLDLTASEEEFTVSKNATSQIPTKIGVVPGEKFTVEELLNAALLTSANDAVEVIKDGVDAKYEKGIFMKAMNEKARIIGLKNTHFENPQGFDGKEHFSTIEDLTLLSHYALTNYPIIKEIVRKDYEYLEENTNHNQYKLYNWNGLIDVYPGASGIKIGNTDDAGKTSVVTAIRDGKEMIAIVLGAPGIKERDLWVAELLDTGFENSYGLERIGITEDQLQEKYNTWVY